MCSDYLEPYDSLTNVLPSSKYDEFPANDEEPETIDLIHQGNKGSKSPLKKRKKTGNTIAQSHQRLQSTHNSSDLIDDDLSSLSADLSLLNYMKKMDNRNNQYLKRLIVGQEKLERSMRNLFDNQKKIQKAFCMQQVSCSNV